ncbi:hypothetical protein TNIN_238051 [Trichonephila inaurata madagascariensis]|uniref:Uncharacterized protein n=1 Tax=Trichonephila inaurata madagascariensis TaxID=2747483 RepID=A0A8X6XIQ7_9ARAC|nr:hypothetical protein TNIN_238051 [Trichonephila inaurata madagascariensis]
MFSKIRMGRWRYLGKELAIKMVKSLKGKLTERGKKACEAESIKERSIRNKLPKLSKIDTGELPYEIIFVVDKLYMITANIYVADELVNGAEGKLSHVELDDQN